MFKCHQRQRLKINVILFGFKNYFLSAAVDGGKNVFPL
jgi:hypothetical protein